VRADEAEAALVNVEPDGYAALVTGNARESRLVTT